MTSYLNMIICCVVRNEASLFKYNRTANQYKDNNQRNTDRNKELDTYDNGLGWKLKSRFKTKIIMNTPGSAWTRPSEQRLKASSPNRRRNSLQWEVFLKTQRREICKIRNNWDCNKEMWLKGRMFTPSFPFWALLDPLHPG